MHSYIRPNTYIALRLPSGIVKVLEITPNTNINIGKFGTFPANLLLGRPYYLTYELVDREEEDGDRKNQTELRIVPAAELHAETEGSDNAAPMESAEEPTGEGGVEFDIVGEDGEVIMRNNRLTVDDPSRQTLSMEEIEELKKAGTGSGKEIIAKIMASHMALDQKTKFSLAKYTLRKTRKYIRRFTVLPMDVGVLTEYVLEKEAFKIMELREEMIGLITAWANIHCADSSRVMTADDGISQIGGGRWLVVDDTAGLAVAAMAEKMGLLYPAEDSEEEDEEEDITTTQNGETEASKATEAPKADQDVDMPDAPEPPSTTFPDPSKPATPPKPTQPAQPRRPHRNHIPAMSASTNTITVIHNNNQPSLALLKYFSFDACDASPSHPLYHHLKSLSWLQLLYPEDDDTYTEPEIVPDDQLAAMKSSKRGNYFKKRRRWEKTARVVDEVRRGGYDGLVVASVMEPVTVLRALVPLVKGGGKVVVYSHSVEPLVELADFYSKERRAAWLGRVAEARDNPPAREDPTIKEEDTETTTTPSQADDEDEDPDFPVNPTLLLAPTIITSRARHFQVLPGRTHPAMTSRGGAEGYVFTATRVLPAEGRIEARGNFRGKKRKVDGKTGVPA